MAFALASTCGPRTIFARIPLQQWEGGQDTRHIHKEGQRGVRDLHHGIGHVGTLFGDEARSCLGPAEASHVPPFSFVQLP